MSGTAGYRPGPTVLPRAGGVPGQPAGDARSVAALRARGALVAARGALEGTPGRLRVAGLVAALASLAFAVLAALSFQSQAGALSDARDGAAQLVRVQSLQTDLFQAHADATNAFLTGGLEPAAERQDYLHSVAAASALIAEAARANPADAAQLGQVNAALTVYTGLVEQARANNRQGFPVGSAYLRQATDVLENQMKPALAQVQGADEALVTAAYARAGAAALGVWLPGLLVLLVLLGVQGWLALRTHRVVNAPLAGATAAVLVAVLAGLGVMALAESGAQHVRDHSYAATRALAQARIAAYEGKANESLTLINRGTGGDVRDGLEGQRRHRPATARRGAGGGSTRAGGDVAAGLDGGARQDPRPGRRGQLGRGGDAGHRNGRRHRQLGVLGACLLHRDGAVGAGHPGLRRARLQARAAARDGRARGAARAGRGRCLVGGDLATAGGVPMTAATLRTWRATGALVVSVALLAACAPGGTGAGGPVDAGQSPRHAAAAAPAVPALAPRAATDTSCGNPEQSYDPSTTLPSDALVQRITKRGRLVAGVSADTYLFGARNPFTDQIEGFDIDMVRALAKADPR